MENNPLNAELVHYNNIIFFKHVWGEEFCTKALLAAIAVSKNPQPAIHIIISCAIGELVKGSSDTSPAPSNITFYDPSVLGKEEAIKFINELSEDNK